MPILYLGSRFICNYVAQLYPAYRSYKALRTKSLREVVPWLMYWILLALFGVVETVADLLVFWIPLYYEVKAVFVLWLILGQGHIVLYRHFVHPTLRKHELAIDQALQEAQSKAVGTGTELGQRGFRWFQDYAMEQWTRAIVQQTRTSDIVHQGSLPMPRRTAATDAATSPTRPEHAHKQQRIPASDIQQLLHDITGQDYL